jgi:hypothetical protein
VDPDCDHIFQKNADGTDRDNCPEVFNPDQADEDDDLYGDACVPMPVTTTVQLGIAQGFAHEASTRRVLQKACQEPLRPGGKWTCWSYLVPAPADNAFEAAGTVQGIGASILQGHTRAMACWCPAGENCEDLQYDCGRGDVLKPALGWKAMTVAEPTVTTGSMQLKIASGFPGLVNTSEFAATARKENWGWAYWEDAAKNDPNERIRLDPPPTTPGSTGTVFQGLLWTWVKNYGTQRPAPIVVSPTRAEQRQRVRALELKESVPPILYYENPCRYVRLSIACRSESPDGVRCQVTAVA